MLGILLLPRGAAAMGHGKPPSVQCPPNGDVAAVLAAACPCDGAPGSVAPWRNHGQYVRCVVHLRNGLRKAGCFSDDSFRRTVTRCAARSTCGKQKTVLCCRYERGACKGDPNPADGIAAGECSNDASRPCNADPDCITSTVGLARDPAACTNDGGTPVGSGSICSRCPPPAP